MIISRERGYKFVLLLSDVLGIASAYGLSLFIRFYLTKNWAIYKPGEAPLEMYLKTFPYILVIWLVVFRFSGAYGTTLRGVDEILVTFKAVFFSILLSLAITFFYRNFEYSRPVAIYFTILVPVMALLWRHLLRGLRDKILKTSGSLTRVAVIGANPLGLTLSDEISQKPLGYEFVGFITESDASEKPSQPILGKTDHLEDLIRQHNIQDLWIARPGAPRQELAKLVETCLRAKISWKMVPDFYDVMLDWVKIDSLAGIPLIGMKRSNIIGVNAIVKRVLDIIFSSLVIMLTSPVMLVAVLLIKLTSKGPVLFMQKRIGQNEKRFTFLKFRTMYEGVKRRIHKDFTKQWIEGTVQSDNNKEEKTVYKIKDDPRITPVGKWLRKLSIDELPQLFSVLEGDMSLVGPRPALAYELDHYQEWHKRRLETKPGLTGLWQVSGRNLISFEEMVKLDIYYIENWTIGLDLRIILKTIFVVLFGRAY